MATNSIILNTFLMVACNETGYTNFLIVEIDRSIKKSPIAIKENAGTVWGLMLCD